MSRLFRVHIRTDDFEDVRRYVDENRIRSDICKTNQPPLNGRHLIAIACSEEGFVLTCESDEGVSDSQQFS